MMLLNSAIKIRHITYPALTSEVGAGDGAEAGDRYKNKGKSISAFH